MFRSYRDLVRTPKDPEKPTFTIFNCNMCDKGGWITENDVEIHKKEVHCRVMDEYKSKYCNRFCTICMTLLESHNDLISHIKTQHLLSSPNAQRVEQMIYICDECTHIFFNKNVLITHMLYVHLTKKNNRKNLYFTCPKCFKQVHLKTIWFHLQNHEIPSVSLCDICLCNFRNRTELHDHVATHQKYYKCEPCGYNSIMNFKYELHLRMHTLREVPRRKVSHTVLNSVFKKHTKCLSRYNTHNTIKGLILPKFIDVCTLCREICVSQAEMNTHILRDHIFFKDEMKKHLCVCGEEFYNKVVLKQHVWKLKGSHQPLEESSIAAGDMTWSDSSALNPVDQASESVNDQNEYNKIIDTDMVQSENEKLMDNEQTGYNILDKEQTESKNISDKEQIDSNILDKEQIEINILDKEQIDSNMLDKEQIEINILDKEQIEINILDKEQIDSNMLDKEQIEINILDKEQIEINILEKEQTGSNVLDKEQTGSNILYEVPIEPKILDIEQMESNILDKDQKGSITEKNEQTEPEMIEIEIHKDIINSMEYSEEQDADRLAMAVEEANSLINNSTL